MNLLRALNEAWETVHNVDMSANSPDFVHSEDVTEILDLIDKLATTIEDREK